MQFGIKVPGIPCGTPGCRWDQTNKTFPQTHETAPLFLYKHVILATYSLHILRFTLTEKLTKQIDGCYTRPLRTA